MKITSDDLSKIYDLLVVLPPFKSLNLPCSATVAFEVNRSRMMQGEYDGDPHTIKVSSFFCETWNDVIETVAHEMVHLVCERSGHHNHPDHDKQFRKLAREVCKQFGWKVESF